MWGRIRHSLAAAGCLAVLLCACGRQQEISKEYLKIGITCYDGNDTFLGELLDRFREQLKTMDASGEQMSVTVRDAENSQRRQNDQVKELIDRGCQVLCVNLVDRASPSEIIDLAREAGVPVIFFNREPVQEDLQQWEQLYYVGADARQSGIMQGELAAEAVRADPSIDRNRDGKIQYVVLEGEAGHQDAIIRTENAVDALQRNGIELEKLGYQIANWNRSQAQNRMEQMIGRFHSRIELVLANNDDMALGAMDAYRKLNYTESGIPLFLGIDGTDVGLEAVKNGRLAGTVYNDKEGQAQAMAKLALALYREEGTEKILTERERHIYLPYQKITLENVDEYLQ